MRRLDAHGVFHVLLVLGVVGVNLLQHPGLITFDTKLDLQIDPGAFMARSTTLWNPDSVFGELQNQASGYLFPLGPFFLLGELLGVPVWVWERLLSALVLLAAYEGTRRTARAWGGLGRWAAVVAGLSYVLAPRLLSTVGALTGEALATAVLPWTVLPLVLHLQGRLRLLPAAVLSAATVPFMGGHNATEVLSALAFPGLLVLFGTRTWRHRLLLTGAWGGLTLAVCLWWLLPLLSLGRYGSPFLDYIESARTTTDRIGWLSALRGTDHWVTFLTPGDNSSWQAGYALASSPTLLVVTVLGSTLGLVGLLSPRLPRRGVLVAALLVGMFALTAGSGGVAGSLLDGPWTAALDEALAPFRNVHKFDPVVRLVLALGMGATTVTVRRALEPWAVRRFGEGARRATTGAVLVGLALPLAVAGLPAVQGKLRDDTGFRAIPDSWYDASDYLADLDEPVRALVLPGSGFAIQTWGRTIDEPMQVLSSVPWGARTQTPLVGTGSIRTMDAIEDALVAGRPEPQLAAMLGRAGITHVVLRNDLDFAQVDSPKPELVHRVFDGAAGLLQVANFGTSETMYPAIEIYAVASPSPDPRIHLFDADETVTVSGGAESMRQLLSAQLLDWGKPMIRATGSEEPVDVVTDSLRRVERNFGRVHFATSDLMTADDEYRTERAAHDYSYADDPPPAVVRYEGISNVLASSSSGYADSVGAVRPEEGPFAAVDGSLLTSWVTVPFADPKGSWIELRFDEPTVLGRTGLRFDLETGAGVRRIRIETDGITREAEVDLNGNVRGLTVDEAPTTRVRFTVLDSNESIRPVVLNEIGIEGLEVRRTVVAPGVVGDGSSVVLRGGIQRPACVGVYGGLNCGADYQLLTTDSGGWSGEVSVAEDTSLLVTGTVVAAGGEATAELLGPIDPDLVVVRATSWFGGDPAVVPQNAVDGHPETTWLSAVDDEEPVLDLRWDRPRTISRVFPTLAPGTPGVLPRAIVVESAEGEQRVELNEFSRGDIEPVRTDFLRVRLERSSLDDEATLGVSELEVDGLPGRLKYHAAGDLVTGAVCGLGPTVRIGRTEIPTSVTGTVGDVISGAPLRLQGCGQGQFGIDVRAGQRTVRVTNADGFSVRDLALTPDLPSVSQEPDGRAEVEEWGGVEREIDVDVDEDVLLAVTQGTNPGWQATLGGDVLEQIEVDGWMQGYLLPAGTDGTVELTFVPQRRYVVGLVAGLVLAGLVLLAAVALLAVPRWRRPAEPRDPVPVDVAGPPRRRTLLAVYAALAILSLPALAGGVLALPARRLRTGYVVTAILVVMTVATVLGVRGLADTLAAPEPANVLTAVVVGLVCVLALRGRESTRE